MLNFIGAQFQKSVVYATEDDDSGCTYHPGRTGWAQVMHTGPDVRIWNFETEKLVGKPPQPTCAATSNDPRRRRVCACTSGIKPVIIRLAVADYDIDPFAVVSKQTNELDKTFHQTHELACGTSAGKFGTAKYMTYW